MKKLVCFVVFCVLMTTGSAQLFAQLAVNIKINQMNYLPFEPIFVQVSIRNFSAHALAFGNRQELQGGLHFEIVPMGGKHRSVQLLDPKTKPPLTGSIIPAGATIDYTFNLCDYYDLRRYGRFEVQAVVKHHLFHESYTSNVVPLRIVKGVEVWSAPFGVPELTGGDTVAQKKIVQRRYIVLTYNTGHAQVYNLMVEDKNRVYVNRRVAFDFGTELLPECQIDFLSRLHTIFAASERVFAYYVFTPDGRLESRKVLIKTNRKPTLTVDPKNGYVALIGGREAIPDQDYEDVKGLPFLGSRAGSATIVVPPKGDVSKDLDAVQE